MPVKAGEQFWLQNGGCGLFSTGGALSAAGANEIS
jgi:hypothetical protein